MNCLYLVLVWLNVMFYKLIFYFAMMPLVIELEPYEHTNTISTYLGVDDAPGGGAGVAAAAFPCKKKCHSKRF